MLERDTGGGAQDPIRGGRAQRLPLWLAALVGQPHRARPRAVRRCRWSGSRSTCPRPIHGSPAQSPPPIAGSSCAFDGAGVLRAEIYAGLFAAPAEGLISSMRVIRQGRALDIAFDLDEHDDAAPQDIETALAVVPTVEALATYDIGQGAANALLNSADRPALFFDLGCGVYRNATTTPPGPLRFCLCGADTIILSHWDADHWAGALKDRRALTQTWIVPRQTLGPKHKAFAADILSQGGRLLIVPNAPRTYQATNAAGQSLRLRRGTGAPSDRNRSGLVLSVEDGLARSGRGWLLTGDAGYDAISLPISTGLAAVVVPHHGATMGAKSDAAIPSPARAYHRLCYSFGPDKPAHIAAFVRYSPARAGCRYPRHPGSTGTREHQHDWHLYSGFEQDHAGGDQPARPDRCRDGRQGTSRINRCAPRSRLPISSAAPGPPIGRPMPGI